MRRSVAAFVTLWVLSLAVPAQASPVSVSITNRTIDPRSVSIAMNFSSGVSWTNNGTRTHHVHVRTFTFAIDPGATSPTVVSLAAQRLSYTVDTNRTSRGIVNVPDEVDATSKTLGTPFTLTWSHDGAQSSYDVQAKYPHADGYVTLFHATTDTTGTFLPPRRGTYKIRSRFTVGSFVASYSLPITIVVT